MSSAAAPLATALQSAPVSGPVSPLADAQSDGSGDQYAVLLQMLLTVPVTPFVPSTQPLAGWNGDTLTLRPDGSDSPSAVAPPAGEQGTAAALTSDFFGGGVLSAIIDPAVQAIPVTSTTGDEAQVTILDEPVTQAVRYPAGDLLSSITDDSPAPLPPNSGIVPVATTASEPDQLASLSLNLWPTSSPVNKDTAPAAPQPTAKPELLQTLATPPGDPAQVAFRTANEPPAPIMTAPVADFAATESIAPTTIATPSPPSPIEPKEMAGQLSAQFRTRVEVAVVTRDLQPDPQSANMNVESVRAQPGPTAEAPPLSPVQTMPVDTPSSSPVAFVANTVADSVKQIAGTHSARHARLRASMTRPGESASALSYEVTPSAGTAAGTLSLEAADSREQDIMSSDTALNPAPEARNPATGTSVISGVESPRVPVSATPRALPDVAPTAPQTQDSPRSADTRFVVETPKPYTVPGQITVRLEPPELGRVRIDLASGPTGIIGRLRFHSEATRAVVAEDLPGLHRSLADAGVRVQRLELAGATVSVGGDAPTPDRGGAIHGSSRTAHGDGERPSTSDNPWREQRRDQRREAPPWRQPSYPRWHPVALVEQGVNLMA